MPKRFQNRAKIDEKSMPKRLRKTHRKKHKKNIKNWCQNGAKINEQSMKNRCRHGRRHRNEKRTLEVWISLKKSNPQILKIYENPKEILCFFEFRPFRFEGPPRRNTFKKRCQKSLKNMCFFIKKAFQNSFENRRWKHIKKSTQNYIKMEAKVVQQL